MILQNTCDEIDLGSYHIHEFFLLSPREAQHHREKILNKLTATQQEQTVNEEQRIAKAVAEREAKQAHLQLAEEERRAVMLKLIVAQRQLLLLPSVEQLKSITRQEMVERNDQIQKQKRELQYMEREEKLKPFRLKRDAKKLQSKDHQTDSDS